MTTTALRPAYEVVLPPDAPRNEWLAHRRTGVGSSDASSVAGLNHWSTPRHVYLDKIGELAELVPSDAMHWGTLLEPVVADWFATETGMELAPMGLLRSVERPWQLATPDRGVVGQRALLEVKTTDRWMAGDWADDQVPDHAEIQTQHQLAVTGFERAWVACLIGGNTPLIREVKRDQELIDDLNEIERRFWERVVNRQPPPVDGSVASEDLLATRWEAVEDAELVIAKNEAVQLRSELKAAQADLKAAAERERLAKNRMRDFLGEHSIARLPGQDGLPGPNAWTWKQNGAFATARFAKDNPEIAAAYVRSAEVLDVERIQAEHPDLFTKYRARVLRIPNWKDNA